MQYCVIPGCNHNKFYSFVNLCAKHDQLSHKKRYVDGPGNTIYIPFPRRSPKYAIITDRRYAYLGHYPWQLNPKGYATLATTKTQYRNNTPFHHVLLHMMQGPPEGLVVDHINRNKLDNRRDNLRLITQKHNVYNSHYSNNAGISKTKHSTYTAHIYYLSKKYYIGTFKTRKQAKLARKIIKSKLLEYVDENPSPDWLKKQIEIYNQLRKLAKKS